MKAILSSFCPVEFVRGFSFRRGPCPQDSPACRRQKTIQPRRQGLMAGAGQAEGLLSQTHAYRVGDATQPSHPLSSPSPPAFYLSQHQGKGLILPSGGNHVVFLELRRHSRVTTGISAFPLGWPCRGLPHSKHSEDAGTYLTFLNLVFSHSGSRLSEYNDLGG